MLKYPSVIKNELNTPKKVYFATLEETKEEVNFGHLKWGEYITIVFIILFGNLDLLTDYLKLSLIHGGTLFTTAYIFAYLIIGLPLTSLNLFLGHFCKCGFFRLWSISPIYRGVGYTMVLLGLCSIIWSSVITSLSFLYMLNLLREEIPWTDCSKMNLNNNMTKCLNYNDLNNYVNNDTCCPYLTQHMCPENSFNYPSISISCLYYFRNTISNIGIIPKLNNNFLAAYNYTKLDLALCLGVTWIITIAVSTIGLNTTKSLTRKAGTFATMSLIVCFVVTLIIGIPQSDEGLVDSTYNIFEEESLSLIRLIGSVFGRSLPLNVVCLGARAPATTTPTIDALFTTIVYLIMMFIFTFWTTIKIGALRHLIKVQSVHCISRSGTEVLLALIPDLIVTHFPFAVFFAFLYYFSLYTLGLLTQIIFITGVLDSIEDVKPTFHHYRLQFCILLCTISYCFGIILTTPIRYIIIESWFFFARHLVNIIAITLYGTAVMWIYGANRLQNDIDFMYKTKLSMTFWIICWKCFPFVAAAVLIYILIKVKLLYEFITEQFYMKQISAIFSLLILLPIPCTAVYHYFRNIRFIAMNNATSLFKNNAQWGPPDAEVRRARNRFNPKYEKRYKAEIQQCPHNCLVNSKRLAREVERLEANRKLFLEEIKKLQGDESVLSERTRASSRSSLTQIY